MDHLKKTKNRIEDSQFRRFTIYFSKWTREALFSTWYGAYGCFRDLTRRKVCDKTLHDKVFNIAKNPGFKGYQRSIALMVYTFFDKKMLVEQLKIK